MDTVILSAEPATYQDHHEKAAGKATLGAEELRRIHAYWRACNFRLRLLPEASSRKAAACWRWMKVPSPAISVSPLRAFADLKLRDSWQKFFASFL